MSLDVVAISFFLDIAITRSVCGLIWSYADLVAALLRLRYSPDIPCSWVEQVNRVNRESKYRLLIGTTRYHNTSTLPLLTWSSLG